MEDLGAEDYLALTLLNNQDSGNVLWEFVFGKLDLTLYLPPSIDEAETRVAESDELSKGGMVFVNIDNDDKGSDFDYIDPIISDADDDIAKLRIDIPLDYVGKATLSVEDSTNDINIWLAKGERAEQVSTKTIELNVPGDFVKKEGVYEKTVWVEGVNAHTEQRQSAIKLELQNDDKSSDEVAITVIGVESVSWLGRGNGITADGADTDTLGDDPNWPSDVDTIPAKRVFPGARLVDVEDSRDKVDVEVTLTVEPVSELTLYLKPFDVDDPTADSDILDDESEAEDNRGDTIAKAGQFTGADSATGVLALLFEEEDSAVKKTATAEFQTTMQPGDNFRIVASIDEDHFEVLTNDDKELKGSSNEDRQRIVDTSIEASPEDAEIISPENYASPVLTVWRYVHIEVDSMGAVEGNSLSGNITDVTKIFDSENDYNDLYRVMTDIQYSLENINHRFSGGQLRVEGQVFTINRSSHRLLHVEDGYEIESDVEDYRLRFYVEAHGLSDPEIQPRVGQFVAVDDDDFNNDDVIMQGERDVGIKDGDEGELVPKPDLNMVDASDLNDCSADSCNVFAKAYIRPIYDLSVHNSTVPFIRNPKLDLESDSPSQEGLLETYDFGQSITEASEKFWTVYILGAYQADVLNDCDTTEQDVEPCVSGQVDKIGGVGASIFYESWREAAKIDPGYRLTASKVTAHELGHLLGGKHTDLGLMGSAKELHTKNIFVMPLSFSDRSLFRMRSIEHP